MYKPIFYKKWYQLGISRIDQFIKEKPNMFFTLSEFEHIHNVKVCPLTFHGILSTLKGLWRNQNLHPAMNNKEQTTFATDMLKSNKPNRLAYQKLLQSRTNFPIRSQQKWCNLIQKHNDQNWYNTYQIALKCTKSTKLIEFHFHPHFRFLHKILANLTMG